MALNAYLTLKGQKQGAIKGGVVQKGREGTILVHAATHDVVSPRDVASGMASGKRMHKPFVITKQIDKATPMLYQAFVTNETLSEWTLRFFQASTQGAAGGAGVERQHYTVKLTNASISAIAFRMPDNQLPDLARLAEHEEIAFVYQKIEWTWVDGAITASDDWNAAQL